MIRLYRFHIADIQARFYVSVMYSKGIYPSTSFEQLAGSTFPGGRAFTSIPSMVYTTEKLRSTMGKRCHETSNIREQAPYSCERTYKLHRLTSSLCKTNGKWGWPSSYSGITSSYSGITSSYSGNASSYSGNASSYSGNASSYSGITSSYSGNASSYSGNANGK